MLLPAIVYLIFILPVFVENNAGCGLSMPQNILAWGTMVLCMLLATMQAAVNGQGYAGRFMAVAVVAVALLILPWQWTPSPLWRHHALPRMAGIAGALLFALALCQVRTSSRLRRAVLCAVVLSSLIQAGEAMLQAWQPAAAFRLMDFSGSSPYGIFQQRNVLASWLATGAGVSMYLTLTAGSRCRALGWALSLYPLCGALVLTQSRVGALGLMVVVVLIAVADRQKWRRRPIAALRRLVLMSSLVVWCLGISLWAMPSGRPADFAHPASTEQRLRVLEGSLQLVMQHPFAGNGLGSFEATFPEALARAGLESQENDTVTHPHNELVYVAAEGGAVSLTGFLMLAGLWVWPAFRRLSSCAGSPHCSSDRMAWFLPFAGLPVVIHMMTEYPLYQSAPHLMLLIILFRIGLPDAVLRPVRIAKTARFYILPACALLMVAALVVLVCGFSVQRALTHAEIAMNEGRQPVLPPSGWKSLTQAERLSRDRYLLMANRPGFGFDSRQMQHFTLWGAQWLAVHNDADVSAAMIYIARRRGDLWAAARLRAEAARVFVSDARFTTGGR